MPNWLIIETWLWYFASGLTAASSFFNVLIVSLRGQTIHREIKIKYILYASALSLWSFNVLLFSSFPHSGVSYVSCQLLHIGAILIPVFLLDFVLTFFDIRTKFNLMELKLGYTLSIFFIIVDLFFPSYFISEVVPKRNFPFFMNAGPLYIFWIILFSYLVLTAHLKVSMYYRKAKNLERKRLVFFVFPSLIAYGACAAYFLPVYNIFVFPYPWGSFGSVVLPSVLAYGILSRQFLDIEEIAEAAHRDKLATLGILTASIHHEIKNPLHVIRGLTQGLQMKLSEQGDTKAIIQGSQDLSERLLKQVDRISSIISRMASFVRRKDYTSLKQTPVSLRDVVGDVLLFVQHDFVYENVQFTCDIPDDLGGLWADKGCIEEILLNLILNAFHALKEIKEPEREKKIEIRARNQDNKTVIEIEDNGPGIPLDHQKSIFEAFFTTKETGTGLGLYITKQLVEMNGGQISLESILGKRTKFILEFPGMNPEKASADSVNKSVRRSLVSGKLRTPWI